MCMKRIIFFLLFFFLAVACSGELSPEKPDGGDTVQVDLSFQTPGIMTKSAGSSGENRINNVTLLVFNSAGDRVVYQKSKSLVFQDLSLPGKKSIKIYAIINSSYNFEAVTQLKGFKATLSQFSSNTARNFEMVGSVDTTLMTDCSLSIPINRIAAKIRIESVKMHDTFCCNPDACPQNGAHIISAVGLMNVAASYPYSPEGTVPETFIEMPINNPLTYYTMSGYSSSESEKHGSEFHTYMVYDEPIELYCYPNPSQTKKTMLVIFVSGSYLIPGTSGYFVRYCDHLYSIQLPELSPNTFYDIKELKIENSTFDKNPFESDRHMDLRAEYSMEVKSLSDGAVLERVMKKEVAYAF